MDDGIALAEAGPVSSGADVRSAARVFAALGNPTRLKMVQLLHQRGEMTTAELRVSVPTGDVAVHLQVLVEVGLVDRAGRRRMSGAPVIYVLADGALDAVRDLLR
ncbi:ArsR/SmtB family transcription factor [Nostocoides vanveenii]|uniref:HTH arsR-type domain-containing protein n=1 Tax=Nostocoides vanveenii TaxID=330835 RepID=A0ABN2KZA6_9MICO